MRRTIAMLILLALLGLVLSGSLAEGSGEMTLEDYIHSLSPEPEEEPEAAQDEGAERSPEEAYRAFLETGGYAPWILELENGGYALWDVDADGVPELILTGVRSTEDYDYTHVYYFYDYRDGEVVDCGYFEEQLIELAYSPSQNRVIGETVVADWSDYFFFSLRDSIEFEFALRFIYEAIESGDDMVFGYRNYYIGPDGSQRELSEAECEEYLADEEYISFTPLWELNNFGMQQGQADDPGALTMAELEALRDALEIPDYVVITECDYNPDGGELWEAAGIYISPLTLFSGDQVVASSMLDADTLEPVRMTNTFEDYMEMGSIDESLLVTR